MKILYYDCFSGISGDMNLGALIDVGVDKDYLISELSKLNLNEYEIRVTRDVRKGIAGTKVDVILKNNNEHLPDNFKNKHPHIKLKQYSTQGNSKHQYHQSHSTDNIEHAYSHGNCGHNHHHKHHHRNLRDIETIIKESSLNDNTKDIAINIFLKVAKAEAKVHGKSIDNVHFHEVGAVDSIVDIVGAAICLDYLKIDKVKCSTVEVGSGFVKCAHGVMPVPAPATVQILKGVPLKSSITFEATTPTGAAILAYAVREFTDNKDFIIQKIGYGIGHKDEGEVPNVLRVFIGEESIRNINNDNNRISKIIKGDLSEDCIEDEVYVLECNIDDMNPEIYEYIIELLFQKGALDVYLTSIIMKKGRPAVKLNVLYSIDKEEDIREVVLTETTTLGFRKYKAERNLLARKFTKVNTKYGEITVKNAYYNGKNIKFKPEYEECKKIALENKLSINEIYKEVILNS